MAYNNTNMLRIAQIGAMTRPQFNQMPTLDLGGAVDSFYGAKDAATKRALDEQNRQKMNAYIDYISQKHPEDAPRIALDPMGYMAMLDDNAKAERDQQYKLDYLAKQNANAVGLAKLAAQLKGDEEYITNAMKNVAAMVRSGIPEQDAWKLYYSGQNNTLDVSQLGKKGFEAYDKKLGEFLADQGVSDVQTQKLSPVTQNAINNAKESLKNGYGLGQIGGMGWTTGQGGINRENLARAQRQMNIQIRGALKSVGVGSKELDAAAEAEAYRARLDPRLPIDQQMQILENFENDYLSGNMQKEFAAKYGNKTPIDWSKVSNEDILKGL